MKTLKIVILVVLFVLITLKSKSQSFQFGLKAGISQTYVLNYDVKNFSIPNSTNGYLIGAFTKIGFAGMFVNPEVYFRNFSLPVVSNTNSTSSIVSNTSLNYIDVPVLFGKKLFRFFSLSAGPNFQFLINKQISNSNQNVLGNGEFNDFVLGAQLGAGLDIWRLTFDFRYDFSINTIGKIANTINNSNVDFSSRTSMLQFKIGYKFVDF